MEELYRWTGFHDRLSGVFDWNGKRLDLVDVFRADIQRCATGRDDVQSRGAAEELDEDWSGTVDLLKIVENEQQLSMLEVVCQVCVERSPGVSRSPSVAAMSVLIWPGSWIVASGMKKDSRQVRYLPVRLRSRVRAVFCQFHLVR